MPTNAGIQAGDAFFAPWPEPDAVTHLFFVISDSAQDRDRLVVVPLMTWDQYKDNTCTIEKGEHDFVRHRSYIDYRCAKMVAADFVEKQIKTRAFRKHSPASATLLAKIREGAAKSDFLALGLRDILEDQELVDPL
jgi:hypothetical protein